MKDGQEINAIIWDIGNVLLTLDFPRAHNYFMKKAGFSKEDYFNIPVLKKESVDSFERGEIPEQRFFEMFIEQLDLKMDIGEFKRVFNDIFIINKKNVSILKKCLDLGLVSAALSNTNSIHLPHIMHEYPFLAELDDVIASFKVGFIKPSMEIYHLAIEKLKIAPEKTLFIDDRIENIQAAEKTGMQTFHYLCNDMEFAGLLKSLCPDLSLI